MIQTKPLMELEGQTVAEWWNSLQFSDLSGKYSADEYRDRMLNDPSVEHFCVVEFCPPCGCVVSINYLSELERIVDMKCPHGTMFLSVEHR